MSITRRNLLTGASAGAGVTLTRGLNVSFAAEAARDILIVVFQRGACDWLQMLAPAGDANYVAARPTIRVPTTGINAGLGLATLDGVDLYLSRSAPELKALYDTGHLAFVHATGLYTNDRSHFTCQDRMEKGVADADGEQYSGWLARHLQSAGTAAPLGVVSAGATAPTSLLGDKNAIAMTDPANFRVTVGAGNFSVLKLMNSGSGGAYMTAAKMTLNSIAAVQAGLADFKDTSSQAGYTSGPLSQALRTIGKLIKMDVGLDTATVDFGSWDHHNNLLGEFNARTTEFSRALSAFWTDMAAYRSRITLVTMTEFGRRLQENASQGTDHGAASGMLVLGGSVNGGRVFGMWPGLASSQLDNGDLTVTTDYRQVLAEILVKRHGENNLAGVFSSIAYTPLGIVRA